MTKNYFFTVLFALCAMFFVVSCNPADSELNEPIAVNLRGNITPATVVRVANDQWQSNDQIGFFMMRTGESLRQENAANGVFNTKKTIQGDVFISNPPVMFPATGNVDFIAYYPFTSQVQEDWWGDARIPVTVGDQSAGLATEVLFSNNITNQAPTSNAVILDFRYSLAKLEITVTGGTNSPFTAADFADMTISIGCRWGSLPTQAELRLTDGTFTNHTEHQQTIALYRVSSNDNSATFKVLLLPTGERDVIFHFNIGGIAHPHTLTANYQAATLYQINFSLDFPAQNPVTLSNTRIVQRVVQSEDISINLIPVTGVRLNHSTLNISVGHSRSLWAIISPENALNQNVRWSSSDTSVATVDRWGTVTAVSDGTAIITATTECGLHTATCWAMKVLRTG